MTMNDTRIAILGGRGMLGTEVAKVCGGDEYDVRILDLPEFDITNPEQIKEALGNKNIIDIGSIFFLGDE